MNSIGNAARMTGTGVRVFGLFFVLFFWAGNLALRAEGEAPGATNLWRFAFDYTLHDNSTVCTPAIAPDGTVYVGTFNGKLYALTSAGKEQWMFQAGREIKSSPAVADDGTIYFGCRDHKLYAITPAGKLKWTFRTDAWVDSSPGIAPDGTVYFGSWDKNFYALTPDGSLKWKFSTGGIVDSSPAIAADGTVYFGSHDKKFYALDSVGKLRWTFKTEAEVNCSPAIGEDGGIYFSSTDGNLYRLRPDGTERWRFRIGGGSSSSPVLDENGNAYLAAGYRTLAVSAAGEKMWDWGSPAWLDETPAVLQGTVCFSQPWRRLQAKLTDGRNAWYAPLQEDLESSPVVSDQGVIYFSCGRYVQATAPLTASLPAKSSWPMFRADARHTGRVQIH